MGIDNFPDTIVITSFPDRSKSIQVLINDFKPPEIPRIISTIPADAHLFNTFEQDMKYWKGAGVESAAISLDGNDALWGRSCLKVTNVNFGGDFGVEVNIPPYHTTDYPYVSFDYKLPVNVKINFYF